MKKKKLQKGKKIAISNANNLTTYGVAQRFVSEDEVVPAVGLRIRIQNLDLMA